MTNSPEAQLVTAWLQSEWAAIARTMSIVDDSFEDTLSFEDAEVKPVPAEPRPYVLFRFGDVIYMREPTTGTVIEARHENGTMQARVFASDGSEVSDFKLPLCEPEWN